MRRGDLHEDDPDFVCCVDVRDSGLRRHSNYRADGGYERDYEGEEEFWVGNCKIERTASSRGFTKLHCLAIVDLEIRLRLPDK
jgi:hypothetical protein